MKGKQRHRGWWKASCRGRQSQARKAQVVLAGWLAGWLAGGGGGGAKGAVVTGVSSVWRRTGGRRKRRAGSRVGGGLLGCGVWKCFAMADAILTRCWLV